MFTKEIMEMLTKGIGETLYMVLLSTLLAYVIGLPLGVILNVTDKGGLKPNAAINKLLGTIVINITRSVPFVIFALLIGPLTKFLIGKSTGPTAMVVALSLSAAPLVARMVESSLNEVDKGVIEAARSMGATNRFIVFKVMLVEARISLISGATICLVTIIGYSAMGGFFGSGGLGDIAVRYGYHRYDFGIMIITVVLLVVLVLLFQAVGNRFASSLDRRK
ncbi:ABC transporter permease [Lachnospiraceae bacterium OttesenSCG-928-J05]|nr:ABC transporter permease [Lachnospiraceae bacterium OttesenSCG-928-J05]